MLGILFSSRICRAQIKIDVSEIFRQRVVQARPKYSYCIVLRWFENKKDLFFEGILNPFKIKTLLKGLCL